MPTELIQPMPLQSGSPTRELLWPLSANSPVHYSTYSPVLETPVHANCTANDLPAIEASPRGPSCWLDQPLTQYDCHSEDQTSFFYLADSWSSHRPSKKGPAVLTRTLTWFCYYHGKGGKSGDMYESKRNTNTFKSSSCQNDQLLFKVTGRFKTIRVW